MFVYIAFLCIDFFVLFFSKIVIKTILDFLVYVPLLSRFECVFVK